MILEQNLKGKEEVCSRMFIKVKFKVSLLVASHLKISAVFLNQILIFEIRILSAVLPLKCSKFSILKILLHRD